MINYTFVMYTLKYNYIVYFKVISRLTLEKLLYELYISLIGYTHYSLSEYIISLFSNNLDPK